MWLWRYNPSNGLFVSIIFNNINQWLTLLIVQFIRKSILNGNGKNESWLSPATASQVSWLSPVTMLLSIRIRSGGLKIGQNSVRIRSSTELWLSLCLTKSRILQLREKIFSAFPPLQEVSTILAHFSNCTKHPFTRNRDRWARKKPRGSIIKA